MDQSISFVAQKKELFSGTILENMQWGNHDATLDEITHALKTAQADDFVEQLKDGLNARVERGGANFSGGQKQRLCIARGLLKKANILILDDCFSALDFKTDALLRRALREYNDTMTQIIVSQRVGTIMNADHILVLDDGKAVGFGTHNELFHTCQIYREICHSQNIEEVTTHE